MKKTFSALLILSVLLCAAFCGCSKMPEEPATTAVEHLTYINMMGETVPYPDSLSGNENLPVKYEQTIEKVDFVMNDYYVYGKNAAEISLEKLVDSEIPNTIKAYFKFKMLKIGSRSQNMKIGYTAYDADGNILKNSYMLLKLKGVRTGKLTEPRLASFPAGTAKVVFYDYTESAN